MGATTCSDGSYRLYFQQFHSLDYKLANSGLNYNVATNNPSETGQTQLYDEYVAFYRMMSDLVKENPACEKRRRVEDYNLGSIIPKSQPHWGLSLTLAAGAFIANQLLEQNDVQGIRVYTQTTPDGMLSGIGIQFDLLSPDKTLQPNP